jgi:hypothetical protein
LVNQILFVSDVSRQQMCDEQIRKGMFPAKRVHHGPLLNSQYSAIGHCGCSAHAERLACKRTFAEETRITQYTDCCFLASLGDNMESNLPRLQIKNCVCGIPLRKDGLLLRKENSFPALADGSKERLGVKLAAVLGRYALMRGFPRSLGCRISLRLADEFR